MKTPFDSALRVQRRAIDAIRLSLLTELSREHAVEAECAAVDTRIEHETKLAACDWQTMAHHYVARQRVQRQRLEHNRRVIDASLGEMRGAAMEASGLMQAITGAAASYAQGRTRTEAAIEQAHADDFAGTRIASARHQSAVRSVLQLSALPGL